MPIADIVLASALVINTACAAAWWESCRSWRAARRAEALAFESAAVAAKAAQAAYVAAAVASVISDPRASRLVH